MTTEKPAPRRTPEVTVVVVRSTEAIDLDAWLSLYVAAILEAEGYPAAPQTEAA